MQIGINAASTGNAKTFDGMDKQKPSGGRLLDQASPFNPLFLKENKPFQIFPLEVFVSNKLI